MAFPEKRRVVFIHIPKCAGSDLNRALAGKYPGVYLDLTAPHWTPQRQFITYLKEFVRKLQDVDSIFVFGHVQLQWYLDMNLCRFGDEIFTVVRNPREIAISHAHYVFKRFFEDPLRKSPDSREWTNYIGINGVAPETPRSTLIEIGLRILHDQRIVRPNYLCNYLGRGTADSALQAAARLDIEVTDTTRYSAWLNEKWGVQTVTANKSIPILSLCDLGKSDLQYLEEITTEDNVLYRRVMDRLENGSSYSIYGTDLFSSGNVSPVSRINRIRTKQSLNLK